MTSQYSSQDVTLVCYSSDNDKPIYLDIYVDVSISDSSSSIKKYVYLKYSDESQKSIVYERGGSNMTLNDYSPLFRGWYMQKRLYKSGYVPALVKL